ncbi:MAG: prohibitin family protein [Candidatus Woesebacteria bacterium]|nr:prohibitin family protein [Candidatus Woesebacteria bacterium]
MTTFGAVSGVRGEGLSLKIPFIQSVSIQDVRIRKEQCDVTAASKDLQTVDTVVAVNFNLKPESVGILFREVGSEYKERIVDPAIQETVKASMANFTAEELITKRELVRDDIKRLLGTKLAERGIIVVELNIINFNFSKSFNEAIEAKVTAVQRALEAEKKLVQVKFEAEQKIAEARGKAEALQIEGNAIASNPQIVKLRAIEKWNGTLPGIVGSNVMPFIGNMQGVN